MFQIVEIYGENEYWPEYRNGVYSWDMAQFTWSPQPVETDENGCPLRFEFLGESFIGQYMEDHKGTLSLVVSHFAPSGILFTFMKFLIGSSKSSTRMALILMKFCGTLWTRVCCKWPLKMWSLTSRITPDLAWSFWWPVMETTFLKPGCTRRRKALKIFFQSTSRLVQIYSRKIFHIERSIN